MADLYIDLDGLERTRSSLEHVGDLMRNPLDTMNAQADSATDIDELRCKLKDFGDAWDYGIGRLGKYTGSCADALVEIRKTFLDLDEKLAEIFDADAEGEG